MYYSFIYWLCQVQIYRLHHLVHALLPFCFFFFFLYVLTSFYQQTDLLSWVIIVLHLFWVPVIRMGVVIMSFSIHLILTDVPIHSH